jgi:hypothetical protein
MFSPFCSNPVCIGVSRFDLGASPKEAFGGAFEESLDISTSLQDSYFKGSPCGVSESTRSLIFAWSNLSRISHFKVAGFCASSWLHYTVLVVFSHWRLAE